MLVLALVEVRRAAVVLLEQLAVHFHRASRRFLVAGEQRADHHHAGAEAHALGDVAVVANAAVRDDRLGGHAGTPLERRQLPAACAEAGLEPRDAHLARPDAHLRGVGAPVFEVDHRFGRADVAGDDERAGQLLLDVVDRAPHRVGVAVRDVDGDVVRAYALGRQPVDDGVVLGPHPGADRDEEAALAHALRIAHVVEVEAVHHVEVAVGRQPFADRLVDDGLHVRRHHRQLEAAAAEFHRGVALAAAFHAAFARQQEDVVVVEDFHA